MLSLARLNRPSSDYSSRLASTICLVGILLLSTSSIAATGGSLAAGSLSINDVSLTEGDEGSRTLTFTVTHTGLSDPFYVDAFTADGTATVADNDYTADGGQAGFNGTDGEQLNFSVEVTGDTKDETPYEVFYVDLSNVLPFGAAGPLGLPSISDARGEGKIIDNDGSSAGNPTLSIGDVTREEGDSGRTNFDFTVTLSAGSDPFSIDVATSTAGGTALDGTQGGSNPEQDFIPKQESLNFAGTAGETETFRVQVLGDTKAESDETFFVNLGVFGGSGSKPEIADGQGRGTIANDDASVPAGFEISPAERGVDAGHWLNEIVIRGTGRWNPTTDVNWMGIVSSSRNGQDDGTLQYSVGFNSTDNPNENVGPRVGHIFIGDEVHTVKQSGDRWPVEDFVLENPIVRKLREQSRVDFPTVSWTNVCDSPFARTRSTRAAFESCTIDAVPAATLLVPYFAVDLDGDGKEEVGVKGIDPNGSSRRGGRGAWMQFYNDKGRRLLNVFPGAKFSGLQLLVFDVDGNGKAEPVVLGIQESGASELQLLSAKGGRVQDRKTVSAAGTQVTQLLAFELDGRPGTEIGVAYTAKNGTGHFAVWGLPPGANRLQELAPDLSVIDSKSDRHEWLATDIDGDGRSEIVAGYAGPSGKGATLRVVDPVSGVVLVNKKVLSTSFDQTVWRFADFDPDKPGSEILVGYRRTSNSTPGFRVVTGDGKLVSSGTVAGKTVAHTWEAIRSEPGARGAVRNLVFVGLTRSNGDRAFEVWDPSKKKAKRVGGGTVSSDDSQVLAWLMQDFDGDADNGPEIVAVTRRLGDGSVGFQMFGTDGTARGARVQAFDGTHISVVADPIVFARKTRVDLKLTARTVGGQPEIHVWNVADEVRLMVLDVLSKDVQ